jgi:hypothetical protein
MDLSIACMLAFLVKDVAGRIRHPFSWRMPSSFCCCRLPAFRSRIFSHHIATFRALAAISVPCHPEISACPDLNCTANGTGTAESTSDALEKRDGIWVLRETSPKLFCKTSYTSVALIGICRQQQNMNSGAGRNEHI